MTLKTRETTFSRAEEKTEPELKIDRKKKRKSLEVKVNVTRKIVDRKGPQEENKKKWKELVEKMRQEQEKMETEDKK